MSAVLKIYHETIHEFMKITFAKKQELKTLSEIVGENYSSHDQKLAFKELECMFQPLPLRPKYLVAKEGNIILGFCGYVQSWIDYSVYEIFWVNVKPEFQGKGIGTQLIQKTIQSIKNIKDENKALAIILTSENPKLYEKCGFRIISHYAKDQCLMILRL